MNPLAISRSLQTRLRRASLALLLGVLLGQTGLVVHAVDHALGGGRPVCEVCNVSQTTADTASVPAVARVIHTPEPTPFLAAVPPAPRARITAARDPPEALR